MTATSTKDIDLAPEKTVDASPQKFVEVIPLADLTFFDATKNMATDAINELSAESEQHYDLKTSPETGQNILAVAYNIQRALDLTSTQLDALTNTNPGTERLLALSQQGVDYTATRTASNDIVVKMRASKERDTQSGADWGTVTISRGQIVATGVVTDSLSKPGQPMDWTQAAEITHDNPQGKYRMDLKKPIPETRTMGGDMVIKKENGGVRIDAQTHSKVEGTLNDDPTVATKETRYNTQVIKQPETLLAIKTTPIKQTVSVQNYG